MPRVMGPWEVPTGRIIRNRSAQVVVRISFAQRTRVFGGLFNHDQPIQGADDNVNRPGNPGGSFP